MADTTSKILVLVEGAKTDVALMEKLFKIYQFTTKYQIVSYCTNIYTLYHEMFEENDPESIDLLQLLKSREKDPCKKALFDEAYSDILLIFDLDPQAPDFTAEKICRMTEYFVESSDMGKLYLNYPMVEAFYHMESIPDEKFSGYYATLDELLAGCYKARVGRENRNHDYRKFATTKTECDIVIGQNLQKANRILHRNANAIPPQLDLLSAQLSILAEAQRVAVLCTCIFFIPEYNPALIQRTP